MSAANQMKKERVYLCIYFPGLVGKISGSTRETGASGDAPIRAFRLVCRFARYCLKYSPSVGLDRELAAAFKKKELGRLPEKYWGLAADLSGTARVSGPVEKCAEAIIRRASSLNIAAKAGIGPTIGAAWAASRLGRQSITRVDSPLKESLYDFKVSGLRLDEEDISHLKECGVEIFGDLFKIPAKSIGQRFGAAALLRIDEILGRQDEPLRRIKAREAIFSHAAFEAPITSAEALRTRTILLFKKVFDTLSEKKLAASRFRIIFKLRGSDGQSVLLKKDLALFSASRDAKHLEAVLFPIIEKISAPSGVERISVGVLDQVRSKDLQVNSEGRASSLSEETALQTLNHLISRLGPSRVLSLKAKGSHIPEAGFSYEALGEKSFLNKISCQTPLLAEHRPAFLLKRPLPIKAMALMPDSPPKIIWIGGRERRVIGSLGPERISLEWWRDSNVSGHRDYFKLQDESGLWIWVYREGGSLRWFLHGIWS